MSRSRYEAQSPDGKRVAFESDDGKEAIVWIYDISRTSAMRRLTFGGHNRFPIWSADGLRVAFQSDRDGDRGIFWLFSLQDKTATPFGDVRSRYPINAAFSPDGQWIAYTSTETGSNHHHALWSPDGTQVVYVPGPEGPRAVNITTRPNFTFSNATPVPRELHLSGPRMPRTFDILPDGQRFIGMLDASQSQAGTTTRQIHVVLNWQEELKRLVPTR